MVSSQEAVVITKNKAKGCRISHATTKKTIKNKNTKKNIKYKNHKKTIKKKTKKENIQSLSLFTTNAAGIKLKLDSLKSQLKHFGSGIFTLQETHLKKKGKLHIEGWELFEAIRNKEFGGT